MPENQNLKKLRTKIDKIDDQLFDLLIERAKVSAEVGNVKKSTQKEIIDREREAEILAILHSKCRKLNIDFEYVSNIWKIILNKSHAIQIDGK